MYLNQNTPGETKQASYASKVRKKVRTAESPVFSLLGIYCTQIRPSEFDNIAISGHSGVISRDVKTVDTGSDCLIVNLSAVNCCN